MIKKKTKITIVQKKSKLDMYIVNYLTLTFTVEDFLFMLNT